MKKTFALILALMVVAAFAMTAAAAPAEAQIPTAGGSIAVKVIDDFSGYSANDSFGNGDYWQYDFDGSKMTLSVSGLSGAVYHVAAGEGPALPADADTVAAWATAAYVGYEIKCTNPSDIVMITESLCTDNSETSNEWAALFQNHNTEEEIAAAPIVLVTAKGKVNATEVAAANNRIWGATIPAGFEGWVFFPLSRTNWGGAGSEGLRFVNYGFYMDITSGEEFTVEFTRTALAENLDVVEGQQGGDEPGGNDDPQGTADISTIAFALAAVVSSGALIIRKKR